MRLIDADKLELKHYIQRVSDKVIRYNGTQPEYANYDILAHDIANAPTVKAIPIEWILKWACEFIDPNSEGYKMAMELVHDWRKENEAN